MFCVQLLRDVLGLVTFVHGVIDSFPARLKFVSPCVFLTSFNLFSVLCACLVKGAFMISGLL